jgi:hypothetical protein
MDDAGIRAVLRELGEVTFGTPSGYLNVTREALAERDIEFEEAARWVEDHGGYVDRTEYRRQGLGPNYGKLDVHVRLILPEDALRE